MAAARVYTPEALDTVLGIMRKGDSDQVRLGAAKEIFDRGHGKAKQAIIGGEESDPAVRMIHKIERVIVRP